MTHPGLRRLARWSAVAVLASGVVIGGALVWATSRYADAVEGLARGVGDTVFLSSDGQPWFRLDEARHDVRLSEVAIDLQHAVIAVEDHRFYSHPGIDPIGVARAATHDLLSGAREQGGSTLTQQLARTLFLSNVRTFGRKAREAAIALLLEVKLSKAQILELYLNRIYLSAGVYGVQTMSEALFGKPASAVTLPEAALIAGLIRAPSALSPWSNYDAAIERAAVVLARMRERGFISASQEDAARAARPTVRSYRLSREGSSGWAKDYLRQQFRSVFGGDHPSDWRVQTSFDRTAQEAAEHAVAAGVARLDTPGLQVAFVALDPNSGDVLAMVGGVDYQASTFNRAVRSRRQPGSAFKPMVYAAALAQGFSPVSLVSGLSRTSSPGEGDWIASHAAGEGEDALTLRDALAESNNAAAVVLQQEVSSSAVLALASAAGLDRLPDVPSLALGTGEVSPLELTASYTIFPGRGRRATPRAVLSVRDREGVEVFAQPVEQRSVVSEAVAFQMVSLLRDVVDRGTGRGARALGVRGAVGGKTGTTDDYRDAWFVGFSNSVVAGVWVGFDEPAPIGRRAYAADVALPIWADFMTRTAKAWPATDFAVPPGVALVQLCRVSHLLPAEDCPTYGEFFKPGDVAPSSRCALHGGSPVNRPVSAVGRALKSFGRRIAGLFGR